MKGVSRVFVDRTILFQVGGGQKWHLGGETYRRILNGIGYLSGKSQRTEQWTDLYADLTGWQPRQPNKTRLSNIVRARWRQKCRVALADHLSTSLYPRESSRLHLCRRYPWS